MGTRAAPPPAFNDAHSTLPARSPPTPMVVPVDAAAPMRHEPTPSGIRVDSPVPPLRLPSVRTTSPQRTFMCQTKSGRVLCPAPRRCDASPQWHLARSRPRRGDRLGRRRGCREGLPPHPRRPGKRSPTPFPRGVSALRAPRAREDQGGRRRGSGRSVAAHDLPRTSPPATRCSPPTCGEASIASRNWRARASSG